MHCDLGKAERTPYNPTGKIVCINSMPNGNMRLACDVDTSGSHGYIYCGFVIFVFLPC